MIKYQKDTNNIVTLILDMSGRSSNLINHEIGQAFIPVLEHLKGEKAKGTLKGVILTSAKKTFLASGDLDYLYRARDAEMIFQFSEKMKSFLRDLERPGVPVVAAINGDALSIGFEVALACHYRIALNSPGIKLGLPEIKMGLMPGNGGIIRLMWLLGIERAYEVITRGSSYNPAEAHQAGIIDDLAQDEDEMLGKAKSWLLKAREGRRPWDKKHCSIPGGTANDEVNAQLIKSISARVLARTYNNYPAYRAVLNTLTDGSKVDFKTACRIESRYFTALLRSQTCKNMIRAFWFDRNSIQQGSVRPKGFGKFRPKKVGIIGAGQMGSGIALACLQNGMEVVLKDVSKLIAERGKEQIQKKLTETDPGSAHLAQRIQTTDQARDFTACDIVIEAVFENQSVKQKVTREAEGYLDEYSILGSNTISIPISDLAQATSRPENYAGLHFFHPADEVPLVEIVRGKYTSSETIARAFDFVRSLNKTPIVVKDDWGFYVARVQNTYILEGITMLLEGLGPALIENLGRCSGMPKGALELADEIGLSIVLKYENQAAAHYGKKYIQHPAVEVLDSMIEKLARRGKAHNGGFYDYQEGEKQQLWEGLTGHFPPATTHPDHDELLERFLFAQVIEACWCLYEKVIETVAGANLGSIYGWGFPAFKGGAIQYINDYGRANFISKAAEFTQKYGPRFKITPGLKRLIDSFPA